MIIHDIDQCYSLPNSIRALSTICGYKIYNITKHIIIIHMKAHTCNSIPPLSLGSSLPFFLLCLSASSSSSFHTHSSSTPPIVIHITPSITIVIYYIFGTTSSLFFQPPSFFVFPRPKFLLSFFSTSISCRITFYHLFSLLSPSIPPLSLTILPN